MCKWFKTPSFDESKYVKPVVVLKDYPYTKGEGALTYPKAEQGPRMKTKGKFAGGYPKGALVHFTAGRYETDEKAMSTVSWGKGEGYCFNMILPSGRFIETHPLNMWGNHAGNSLWNGLVGTVGDELVGIEIAAAGMVSKVNDTRFTTSFGTSLTADQVRYVKEENYGCPTGYYHKYTPAQEATLLDYLVWLKMNDKSGEFNINFILGHHEVSGKKGLGYFRKNDPGGSLSMTMDQLRAEVKRRVDSYK